MTEAQSDMAFALKMYGEKCMEAANALVASNNRPDDQVLMEAWGTAYDNMCFWQSQLWQCAKTVAVEE